MARTFVVFDLDGTVIDSDHRYFKLPCGGIDLEAWFDNARPEKIALDTLLPLARSMRDMYAAGHTIIVCTARCMQEADFQFLADHALDHHVCLSRAHKGFCPDTNRPLESDTRGDAEMKIDLLTQYLATEGYSSIREANVILFEDNLKVIDEMMKHDVICFNAVRANAKMRAAA